MGLFVVVVFIRKRLRSYYHNRRTQEPSNNHLTEQSLGTDNDIFIQTITQDEPHNEQSHHVVQDSDLSTVGDGPPSYATIFPQGYTHTPSTNRKDTLPAYGTLTGGN